MLRTVSGLVVELCSRASKCHFVSPFYAPRPPRSFSDMYTCTGCFQLPFSISIFIIEVCFFLVRHIRNIVWFIAVIHNTFIMSPSFINIRKVVKVGEGPAQEAGRRGAVHFIQKLREMETVIRSKASTCPMHLATPLFATLHPSTKE